MALNPAMKVIVVDDVMTMRKQIRTMMKTIGFKNIEEAEDGKSAWEKITEAKNLGAPYGFIICDWHMPNMSGLELLKNVRSARDEVKETPFLMITGEAEHTAVLQVMKAGASDFLLKPITPDLLKQKIVRIFK